MGAGVFQHFFVSHVAAAVVARVYAHLTELRRRACVRGQQHIPSTGHVSKDDSDDGHSYVS